MRHKVWGNQLHRDTNAAKGLYRSLLVAILEKGKIQTTRAKAKAIQGDLDKIINWAKEGSINSRRLVVKTMGNDHLLDNIFGTMAKRFPTRNSGYSRIVRLGQRLSDTAEMVILELVDYVEPKKVEKHDN